MLALAVMFLAVSCRGKEVVPARSISATHAGQDTAQILFYVPHAAPDRAQDRGIPVQEWSFNDDTDTIFVILGGETRIKAADLVVDVRIRKLVGEQAPETQKQDTVGRWVPILQRKQVELATLPEQFGGKQLLILRPSSIQATMSAGMGADEIITDLRVSIVGPGQPKRIALISWLGPD